VVPAVFQRRSSGAGGSHHSVSLKYTLT
jgi:hypothetical protein